MITDKCGLCILVYGDWVKLPSYVRDVLRVLKGAGFKAFVVGGAVRDMLLGVEPNDFDVATNARPDDVIRVFRRAGYKVIPKGIKYGVVSVIHPRSGVEVEVVTFRKEYYPMDYRRRDVEVEYADDITDDLGRRDFTVNAMALSDGGEVIDPYGGLRDIKERVIRFVGDPNERIREDPLRMLRAVRFASKLGFDIDPLSLNAVRVNAGKLKHISRERIGAEVIKAMKGERPWVFPVLLLKSGLYAYVLPELREMSEVRHDCRHGHYGESVLGHTVDVMRRLHKVSRKPELMLACMLHDIGKPKTYVVKDGKVMFHNHEKVGAEIAREVVLRRWRLPARLANYVSTVIKHHMLPIYLLNNGYTNEEIVSKLLTRLPPSVAEDVLLHAYADTGDDRFLKMVGTLRRMIKRRNVKPIINGNDIMRVYRIPPGPQVGRIKQKLYELQLTHNIHNKDELIRKACEEGIICPPSSKRKNTAVTTI